MRLNCSSATGFGMHGTKGNTCVMRGHGGYIHGHDDYSEEGWSFVVAPVLIKLSMHAWYLSFMYAHHVCFGCCV